MNENDLLSIKKFSELTGIKQSTLRYYDEVKLLKPVIRAKNGYRYYSAPQAVAVNFINAMNSLDIPLKKIIEIQQNRTPQLVLELLRKQELMLNRELLRLHQAYATIHAYSSMIQEGLQEDEHSISVRQLCDMPIEQGGLNDFSSGYFYDSFFKFIGRLVKGNMAAGCLVGGFYKDMYSFLDAPGKPTRFFSITPSGTDSRKAGDYLIGYTRGYYGVLGDLPQRMKEYADENGWVFTGPVFELYLHDEVSVADTNEFLIQASVPVKRRRGWKARG